MVASHRYVNLLFIKFVTVVLKFLVVLVSVLQELLDRSHNLLEVPPSHFGALHVAHSHHVGTRCVLVDELQLADAVANLKRAHVHLAVAVFLRTPHHLHRPADDDVEVRALLPEGDDLVAVLVLRRLQRVCDLQALERRQPLQEVDVAEEILVQRPLLHRRLRHHRPVRRTVEREQRQVRHGLEGEGRLGRVHQLLFADVCPPLVRLEHHAVLHALALTGVDDVQRVAVVALCEDVFARRHLLLHHGADEHCQLVVVKVVEQVLVLHHLVQPRRLLVLLLVYRRHEPVHVLRVDHLGRHRLPPRAPLPRNVPVVRRLVYRRRRRLAAAAAARGAVGGAEGEPDADAVVCGEGGARARRALRLRRRRGLGGRRRGRGRGPAVVGAVAVLHDVLLDLVLEVRDVLLDAAAQAGALDVFVALDAVQLRVEQIDLVAAVDVRRLRPLQDFGIEQRHAAASCACVTQ
eukprot:Rhum_TRINITY_DN15155_c2_g1::Rhum_TRINITY_DN15155_c2_g1_i1::g.140813::m.140813